MAKGKRRDDKVITTNNSLTWENLRLFSPALDGSGAYSSLLAAPILEDAEEKSRNKD